ncbi:MAG: cytochrome c-type biogenesis protein [Oceanococcaceae bacterium]
MMRRTTLHAVVLTLTFLLASVTAGAQDTDIDAERMRDLEKELRCLVCQNQSLADSAAPLAQDLRSELKRLLREGKSDDEIRAWMVERYGDFVLYRPPFKPMTWALWLGPFVLLGIGAGVIVHLTRRRGDTTAPAATVDPKRLQDALRQTEKT